MKHTVILLVLLLCVSCNSFQHMQYRKLRKVPADNLLITVADHLARNPIDAGIFQDSTVTDSVFIIQQPVDSAIQPEIFVSENSEATSLTVPDPIAVETPSPMQTESAGGADLHRDWSWVIALLMILGAVFLLMYVVFAVLYMPIFLILRIIFGLLLLFVAFRLAVKGYAILRNRVRQPKNYKESGG